jgi:hypothetical protein
VVSTRTGDTNVGARQFVALLLLAVLWVGPARAHQTSVAEAADGADAPFVIFTGVPPFGSTSENLSGRVLNVNPSDFRLASPSFSAPEGGGKVEVAVARSGDLSAPASGDYATSDGTASERSDWGPGEPPDNNLDGYNFWLGKLNQFGGDYIKAFLSSTEYRRGFGP